MGRRIGLARHPDRAAAADAADDLATRLSSAGCEVVDIGGDADLQGADLVVSLGGDGTFLWAAHEARDLDIAVLGVNLGRLGFLAEVEPDTLESAVRVIAEGTWTVEPRPTLEVEIEAPGVERQAWALNEVSIEKTARQRVLVMDVEVAGTHVTRLPADAIVISTPTGSTAYAFSAGGPILSPRVRGTLVTPVAPHSVFGRTIVAAEDEPVTVRILPDQEPAVVSCDGRDPVEVQAGGQVVAHGGGRPVLLARVQPLDFYGTVRTKFGLR